MLRKAALVLSGNAAAALLTLARNLLVARLIPVADYGIAATLAVAMAVVEMVSALGLQQQIVQAREGEDARFQAALQGFQLLRGLLAAAALLALAQPLAAFLRIPGAAWGYMALAAVPVLNALQHFDIHRLTRAQRFGPLLLTGVVPAALSLAAVWPLARWLGDWRAMLGALLLQAALAAAVSHLVAERPFRIVLDRAEMRRSLRFGWPLLLNGALLFLVFNGDKLIVGRLLGMEALAVFAMGVTLTLTPTLVMARSAQNLFLPRLSAAARGTPAGAARFHDLALAAQQAAFLNGALIALAAALAGRPLVALLLGAKYAALLPLVGLFGVLHALRVWKTAPAVIALARGQTGNALAANLPRVVALPLAWAALAGGGGLAAVLWIAIAAETAGYAVAAGLARWRGGLRLRPALPALAAAAALLAAAAAPALPGAAPPALPAWAWPAAAAAAFAVFLATLGPLWRLLARPPAGNEPPEP
jgi:O-antigen/teichoic acid export membrane protein